jgi:cytochrome c-type biogenesis protein CcmF
MIPEIGHFALILAFIMGLVLSFKTLVPSQAKNFKPTIVLVYLQAFLISIGFLSLVASFINCDFSVQYVAQHSHTGLPLYYRAFALWGAHEGSLLLWIFVQALWMIYLVLHSNRNSSEWPLALRQGTLGILSLLNTAFIYLLLAFSNPFLRFLPTFPTQGQDLNPLLQDPGFILHPPILYIGYVGFSVPFAMTLVSLYLRQDPMHWAKLIKHFVLIPWSFLTLGITLGSWWAYYELGWGGFWFWDPVENASFLPWLLGVALIHSLMATVKRGLFARWSMLLALSTFLLSLVGTFLVRSGVLTSVHAFAVDPARGMAILSCLAIMVAGSFIVFVKYRPKLVKASFSLFSFESLILVNNLVITVGMCSILLGTLYPLILDSLDLGKISVGPKYFNTVFIPFVLILLFCMNFASNIRKSVLILVAAILGTVFISTLLFHIKLSFMSCCALGLSIALIIHTILNLRAKKWGMLLSHIGIAVLCMGIGLTTDLSEEHDLALKLGQSVEINNYHFKFEKLEDIKGSNYEGVKASFLVTSPSVKQQYMYPEKRIFTASRMPMTETAIDPGFFRDLYIAMGEPLSENEKAWSFRIYIKPFVRWLWLGGLLIMAGGIVSTRNTFLVSGLAVGVLSAFFWVCMQSLEKDPQELPATMIDQPLPKISLPNIYKLDNLVSFESLKGKVSVIHFWATWCPACVEEHINWQDHAKSSSVPIIGVLYREDPLKVQAFLKKEGDPYMQVLLDKTGRAAIEWGIHGIPASFIVDKNGIIRKRITGRLSSKIWKDTVLPLVAELDAK